MRLEPRIEEEAGWQRSPVRAGEGGIESHLRAEKNLSGPGARGSWTSRVSEGDYVVTVMNDVTSHHLRPPRARAPCAPAPSHL